MVHKDTLRSDVEKLLKKAERKAKAAALTASLSPQRELGRESPPCNWDTLPMLANTSRESWQRHLPRRTAGHSLERNAGGVKPYASKARRGSLPSIDLPQSSFAPRNKASSPLGKKHGPAEDACRGRAAGPARGVSPVHGGGRQAHGSKQAPKQQQSASLSPEGRASAERPGGNRGGEPPAFVLDRSEACREALNAAFMEAMTSAEVDKWLRDHDAFEKQRRREERKALAATLEKQMKDKVLAKKAQGVIGVAKSVEELEMDAENQPTGFAKFGKSFQQSFQRGPSGSEQPAADNWKQLKRFMRLAQPAKYLATGARIERAMGENESSEELQF